MLQVLQERKKVKNIFITGGTTGIGLSLTQEYLRQGHRVAVFARDHKKWEESATSKHPMASYFAGDVINFDQLDLAMKKFSKQYGPLDLVIVNAGIGNPKKVPVPDFSLTRRIFEINVFGMINTTEAAFKIMFDQKKGHIVYISSIAALSGLSGNGAYCGSKAAMMRMAESYAIDWHQFGIDVTCVFPGFVDTPLTKANPHSMPFLMSSAKAAQIIVRGVENKKLCIGFPWQTYGLMTLLSILPRSFYIYISRRLKLSIYSKKKG